MALHRAEINDSHAGAASTPFLENHLAANTLTDLNVAQKAMTGSSMPAAFGNFAIGSGDHSTSGDNSIKLASASGSPGIVIGYPAGPGSDCGNVTAGPKGGLIISPGPQGCDIGGVTYRKGPNGNVIVDSPSPDSGMGRADY